MAGGTPLKLPTPTPGYADILGCLAGAVHTCTLGVKSVIIAQLSSFTSLTKIGSLQDDDLSQSSETFAE